MKNKLIKSLLFILVMIFTLAFVGCKNENQEQDGPVAKDENTYSIKIIDLDGENLGEKKLEVGRYESVYEAIQGEFVFKGGIGEYGAYLTSINHSIVDKNYSLMLYVNDVESWDSCDKVVPKKGDKIEFRNECWAAKDYGYGTTMDEVDILLDKIIYRYVKNELRGIVGNIKTYTGSTYWDMLFIDLYKRTELDSRFIQYSYSGELTHELETVDINTLTGANIGKYYAHAKVVGQVDDQFSTYYQTQLDALTTFNGYVTPFVIFPNADLKLTSKGLNSILEAEVSSDFTYGPVGNIWALTSQALFTDVSKKVDLKDYVKNWVTEYNFGSNTDLCTVLMLTSALNVNVRDTAQFGTFKYNDKDLDFVNYILTRFYDENLGLVKVYDNDTKINMSTNQIYAGLLAYKAYRYTNTNANIFGGINK